MLQIIGWLGCLMLAVKTLEMMANGSLRGADGDIRGHAAVAIVIGWIGVFVFALWILVQGASFPE